MNLQELLNYRATCLIHREPMSLYPSPDKSPTFSNNIVVEVRDDGLRAKRLGDESRGVTFRFDGSCDTDYNQALKRLKFPWIIGVMCDRCHKVPTHKFMGRTVPTVDNIKHQVHFYTFTIIPNDVIYLPEDGGRPDKYECHPGMEVIKHFDGEKFYHMTGHVGGGSAAFNMGYLNMEDTLDQLVSSTSIIKVPKFNPAVITSIEQMVEKMKIYNLFS